MKSKHQSEYTTEVAKQAMNENQSVKLSKKEQIKTILAEAGFDPKAKYTAKEKKQFTRIVKNKLFVKPKPVSLTSEQIIQRFADEKVQKKIRMDALPFKRGVQKGFTVAELNKKEKSEERQFTYVIQRKSSENEMRCYDFATDYFTANSREDAKNKAKEVAKTYAKDTSFAGIRVKDSKDNNIIYYHPISLLDKIAAQQLKHRFFIAQQDRVHNVNVV